MSTVTIHCPECGSALELSVALPAQLHVLPSVEPPLDLPTPAEFRPIRWTCPKHGTAKTVPAGVSKTTGRPYSAFVVCAERGCEERPPR